MANKLKTASAIILSVCTAVTLFTSCGGKDDETTTAASSVTSQSTTKKIITPDGSELIAVSQDENYTYYMPPETKNNSVSFSFAAPPTEKHVLTTAKPPEITAEKQTNAATAVKTTKPAETTTRRASAGGTVEEIADGITVVTKTSPVNVGNSATIMIHGTPGKKYTIEFYETASKKAGYDGLTEKSADSNGFVSWTFGIENSCEAGNRKIIVREKDSDNFVQTSIIVN